MKKLFVHHPLFRLLSPLFSGALVYLLILLVNNDIEQLKETFLGQELYVCIGLAYLIQEFTRLSLFLFEKIKRPSIIPIRLVIQIIASISISCILVSVTMFLYFTKILHYTPNAGELWIFNSLFSLLTLLYISVFLSHHYMHKINTEKKAKEDARMKKVEADFREYRKGINPDLLFDSLESMIGLMMNNPEDAEELSDYFAAVYRYLLSKRTREMVSIYSELEVAEVFLKLYAFLPFQKIDLQVDISEDFLIIPGSLLLILERVIRSSINLTQENLQVNIEDNEDQLKISYIHQEKLRIKFDISDLSDINKSYRIYSETPLDLYLQGNEKIISLPKLKLHESSHY